MNKPKKRGKYIVMEGGEGVGKTTQITLLKQTLDAAGIKVETFQEPGGDKLGQILRSILKAQPEDPLVQHLFEGKKYDVHPRAELYLFNAARAQALENVARPLLETETWLLADRSFISTLAYQGHGRGLDLESVRTICQFAIQDLQPDLILLLDSPLELARQRVKHRGGTDRIESAGDDVHQRIHAGYRIEAERLGIPVIQASGTMEEVRQQIWSHVEPLVKELTT